MNRQHTIFVSLLVILAVAIVASGYAKGWGPLGVLTVGISRLTYGNQSGLVSETEAATAPEISSGSWINSQPLTLKSLRERVVLIEFGLSAVSTAATPCRRSGSGTQLGLAAWHNNRDSGR